MIQGKGHLIDSISNTESDNTRFPEPTSDFKGCGRGAVLTRSSLAIEGGASDIGTLYPGIVLNADVMVVKSTHMFDKLGGTTKMGDRQEADVHIAFDITDRILDLLVGYRVRNYDIITATETFKEKAQGVYAGIRLGVYF